MHWKICLALLMTTSPLATSCGGSSGGGSASGSGNDGGSGGNVASSGVCATRAGMRGKTMRSVTAGGSNRTYIVYLPLMLDPTKAVPFVYVFHGAGMSGAQMYDITQYSTLADSEGIAVVFPDGQTPLSPWNVSDNGATVCGIGNLVNNMNASTDFALMDAMKADVLQDQCLDDAHVFATGFSMGGYFSHHIGCDRTDIKGVGPHSGGTIADLGACKTGQMPIIIFHGTADSVIADGCDDPTVAAVSGFPASATLWAKKNGCKDTYATTPENGSGGGAGQCYLYDGCPARGQVELCTFSGMSHSWAGGGGGGSFASPTYASATQLEWAFWKKYAW
jgi:polyhydroxybutyrate depolymerase